MKSFTRDQLIFSKGIIASLALHGIALALIVFSQHFDSSAEPDPVSEKPRSYLLVSTGPRPSPKIPDAQITEVLPTPAPGATGPSQTETLEELEPDESDATGTESATETAATGQIADFVPSPAISPGVPPPESSDNQPVENTRAPGLGTAEVNNAVTAYVTNYKRSLTSDWLSACLQYQNEHGVKTCPPGEDGKSEATKNVNVATSQLFTSYVSGAAANIRASKKLLAEMEAARSFVDDDSVMGELARQRYQLAEANYCRLNSCRSFALSKYGSFPSFPTPVSNEGFIKIAGFGNDSGGPGILAGLMSLMPKPKPAQSAAPFVPYRFTGTRTEQAESEDEFKVKAPVFPVTR